MTLDEAKAILAEVDPTLKIDESRPELTHLLSIYREGEQMRTNINLPDLQPDTLRRIAGNL